MPTAFILAFGRVWAWTRTIALMTKPRDYEDMPADAIGRAAAAAADSATAIPPNACDALSRDAPPGDGRALFDAVLYPSRSLSRQGFSIVMGVFGVISLVGGLYFLSRGAWPVTGFFGLDWLGLYAAFRLSYRSGRLHERIRIDREAVTICRILPSGYEKRWRLHPFWVRIEVDKPDAHASRLRVMSRGRSLILGAFLPPAERAQIGRAMAAALAQAKSPAPSSGGAA